MTTPPDTRKLTPEQAEEIILDSEVSIARFGAELQQSVNYFIDCLFISDDSYSIYAAWSLIRNAVYKDRILISPDEDFKEHMHHSQISRAWEDRLEGFHRATAMPDDKIDSTLLKSLKHLRQPFVRSTSEFHTLWKQFDGVIESQRAVILEAISVVYPLRVSEAPEDERLDLRIELRQKAIGLLQGVVDFCTPQQDQHRYMPLSGIELLRMNSGGGHPGKVSMIDERGIEIVRGFPTAIEGRYPAVVEYDPLIPYSRLNFVSFTSDVNEKIEGFRFLGV